MHGGVPCFEASTIPRTRALEHGGRRSWPFRSIRGNRLVTHFDGLSPGRIPSTPRPGSPPLEAERMIAWPKRNYYMNRHLPLFDRVSLSQPFQRAGQSLARHVAIGVSEGFGEDV